MRNDQRSSLHSLHSLQSWPPGLILRSVAGEPSCCPTVGTPGSPRLRSKRWAFQCDMCLNEKIRYPLWYPLWYPSYLILYLIYLIIFHIYIYKYFHMISIMSIFHWWIFFKEGYSSLTFALELTWSHLFKFRGFTSSTKIPTFQACHQMCNGF
jgi:hypothetical protein